MKKKTRIVIAGGTGFLGQSLAQHASSIFDEVVILSRHAQPQNGKIRFAEWDGEHTGPWMHLVDGCDLLVNLTGRSVNCRYTEKNKREILESRLKSTMILGAAVIMAAQPPSAWINSSTATIYRHTTDQPNDESTGVVGDDFSMGVARKWEGVFFDIPTPGTRKVALRTAIVLGRNGGAFPMLRKLVKLGMGGRQGTGLQRVSWIHEQDFLRVVEYCSQHEELEGVVNVAAPDAVTNEIFMETMRKHLAAPFHFHQPVWMLELGAKLMQTEPELILKSRWVTPAKLAQSGFRFSFSTLEDALKDLSHEPHFQIAGKPVLVPAF